MVFASIYGSSASNPYGKGGTVNAMGESSDVKFSLNFPGPSAASKLAPNFSAPSRATPAILPATSKLLRFIKNFPVRRADDDTSQIILPDPSYTQLRTGKEAGRFAFPFAWMRESAQRADSAITGSLHSERLCSAWVISQCDSETCSAS